jgi:hypothetical protein
MFRLPRLGTILAVMGVAGAELIERIRQVMNLMNRGDFDAAHLLRTA